jgi:sugar phosphate isomerase/epimerase
MNRIIGVSTKLEGLTRERFAAYRENGIGAVEVSVAEVHFDELDLATVAKEMRAEGLDAWSFHLRFFPFKIYNIARLNPDERRFAVDYQCEWIKRAGAEGFRYAIIHPSGEPISDEKRPEAMKAACESLDLLAEEAKRAGIVLAVENLPRTCLAKNFAEMLQLLDANSLLRSCFDTNHLLQEDPLAYIEAVKEKIVTLHVSDYDFINERHWLPGDGLLDWKAVMKKLDEIGYNGVFMYETGKTKQKADGEERILTPADYRANAEMLESLN